MGIYTPYHSKGSETSIFISSIAIGVRTIYVNVTRFFSCLMVRLLQQMVALKKVINKQLGYYTIS
jgi:hypothetical protein